MEALERGLLISPSGMRNYVRSSANRSHVTHAAVPYQLMVMMREIQNGLQYMFIGGMLDSLTRNALL